MYICLCKNKVATNILIVVVGDKARSLLLMLDLFLSTQHGVNEAVFNAFQLAPLCNVSINSGKKYAPGPLRHKPAAIKQNWRDNTDIRIYVDGQKGNDSNPGSMSLPVQTIQAAVRRYRSQKESISKQGVIFLNGGTYFLKEPINLGPEDSNLVIAGEATADVRISGGRMYDLKWEEVVNKINMILFTSSFNTSDLEPGTSNEYAKFAGKMANSSDCQKACEADTSCFAFTWFNEFGEDFASLCYFRTDGLWVPAKEFSATSGKKLRILKANLSSQNPTPFSSFFMNGRRAVRARYPDGNPETIGMHTNPTGYVPSAESWLPPVQKPPAKEIHISSPIRANTDFPTFQIGIGGPVDVFDPPKSYWGTKNPVGGGGATFTLPSGLRYSADEDFVDREWAHPETGVLHTFMCQYWGNWIFAIEDRNSSEREITFSRGGFQEARGCSIGREWFIENIFEELDAPNEYFYNETEQQLYWYPNGTTFPTSGVATNLHRLFNIRGTMDDPVYNITFVNLTFTHTEPTYLEPYEVPSGGDYTIHRGGAVFAEGIDGFTVQQCLFDSPGGNGLFMSNYMRNAVVENNIFKFVGDYAIAAVGSSKLMDGTSGEQPRGTKIVGNLIHDFGLFGKQTAAYMQSMSCQTEVTGNVFFNGPRSGINFNDGFGGGNVVQENLGFNVVRETGDHGFFNSWDRQPYLTKVKDGVTPSLIPATSYLTKNFIINNYHSTFPIDHDDGTGYYYDSLNFLVYGGYKSYLGHSQTAVHNIYVFPDAYHYMPTIEEGMLGSFLNYAYCAFSDGVGWGEVWANNICITSEPDIYQFGGCHPGGNMEDLVPFTANNTFFIPGKEVLFNCGGQKLNLLDFQLLGYDIGSHVYDELDIESILKMGKDILVLD